MLIAAAASRALKLIGQPGLRFTGNRGDQAMTLLTFDNPVFRYYAVAAALLIIKMMSQGWITVFRMVKVNAGLRYPEDARKSLANPNPSPAQLLPNEYVERSRRMHGNDVENIPLFLVAGLLYVCTAPGVGLAAGLYAVYVLSRLAHFTVVLMHRSHEARATLWTIGSAIVYFMAGATIWAAARSWLAA
jgi:glutathione S-transferase